MRPPTRLSLSITLLSWVAAVRSQNCQLQVPQNPLTAQGLATPYVLTGCNQIDFANQGAFVEAAILDPATGSIQIYSPLVINAGMVPVGGGQNTTGATATTSAAAAASTAGFFIPPAPPTLPNNAVVGIWFGSNANTLTLTGDAGGCVNGVPGSVFGQFAYCNGQAWFNAAKTAVSQGLTKIPAPGTAKNGQACPTTHDFRIVDQDQSDNLITTYLLLGNNTLAQNTPANSQANPNAEVLSNASDNALVNQFIDPALGCTSYQNPCPTCPTGQGSSLATDELQAFFYPPAGGPALIPLNDDFVLVNGQQSLQKVNLYRDGTGQPQADNNNASAVTYCQQIAQGGIFINGNQQLFSNSPSPAPAMATNLFTFLAMRYSTSLGPFPGLGCLQLLNIANPVTLTMDGNGVVTAATINTQVLQQVLGMVGMTPSATSAATPSTAAATVTTSAAASATSAPAVTTSSTAVATTSVVSTTAAAATTSAPSSSAATTSAPSSSAASTTSSAAATSAPATTAAAPATTSSIAVATTSVASTTAAAATTSAPSSTAASTTSSAAATSAPATSAAAPTGVLLQNTGTTSAIPTSSVATSAAPTSSIATSAIPTSVAPTVTTTTTCTNAAATVTVTVTATVCPSQTSATPTASATTYNDDGGNWNGDDWNDGGWGGNNNRRRAMQMARLHRKRRIFSYA